MRRDVFQAIADPTRRQIIASLSQSPMNLNAVAASFRISRQAVSKHIRVLTECGLLEVSRQGRERYCTAKLEPLAEVSEWLNQYKTFWNNKLDLLGNHLKPSGGSQADSTSFS